MRHIIKAIPNTITSLNLFSGCIALVCALNGDLISTFYFFIASAIFDFLDGFAARALKAYSNIGKELDSLADMVSFGVVPSAVMFTLGCEYFGFIIAVFSALRLAKFNVDTRQNEQFIGLNTPTNSLLFISIGYILHSDPNGIAAQIFSNYYIQLSLIVVFSLLLVSEIPMFSLKFKSFAFSKNKLVYSFLLLSLIAIIILKVSAMPIIVFAYVLISVIQYLFKRKTL